jgi:hypothetical protein
MSKNNFNVRSSHLACLILLGLTAAPLCAQTNTPPPPTDRYLFIVDTSEAMRRRASGVQKAVESLMRSSMAAQFQRGDTVGVWTFNEQLQAGRFPLQVWTPENSAVVTSNVVRFIKAQTYTGASRFEAVMPTLRRIVEQSPRLTILLVSDGDEPIAGTPFDANIKRALASKFEDQKKARMPFVTVLRAARGRIASATVNLAPWPVEFPNFPPEPKIVEAPKPEPKKPEPPRPTVPNLIVIGNKKQDPAVATNIPPTAADLNAPPASAVSSNLPVTEPSAPASLPALTNVAVPPTATAPATDSPAASLQSATNGVSAPITIAAVTPPSVESAQPSTAAPVETPATVAPSIPDEPTLSPKATNPPAGITVASVSDPAAVPWVLVAAGTVPIVLGVGVFFFLQKRARNTGHGSLITRSLDRNRK